MHFNEKLFMCDSCNFLVRAYLTVQLLKVNEEFLINCSYIKDKKYLRIRVIKEEACDVYMEVGGDDVMMCVVTSSHPDRDHMITSKCPLHIIAGVIR